MHRTLGRNNIRQIIKQTVAEMRLQFIKRVNFLKLGLLKIKYYLYKDNNCQLLNQMQIKIYNLCIFIYLICFHNLILQILNLLA